MLEIKKALGRKSRQLRNENRARVFLTIAKKPFSFSELLSETKLSRASLTQHLKFLEKEGIIYKDTIKPTETSNPSEIGKIVYKVRGDEMREKLVETLTISLAVIPEVFQDGELRAKLQHHINEIAEAITEYVKWLDSQREESLKAEVLRIKGKLPKIPEELKKQILQE